MAAAGDAPAGIFSGVWSRLHAAASGWRRRGQASRGVDGGSGEGEEAAVRSRLARRAAAARRVGRKLAFVSFNLEVLVFIYAFWRARRRSLTWGQPVQVLPVLAIPALATLIYAAFVRFTRILDRKDKRTLERLQEDNRQTDGEPRESADLIDKETLERIQEDKQQAEDEPREFDQNNQNNVQNCNGVDDASNSSVAADSVAQTAKLRKHRQSSIKHRDDGGADMAWGHSKDFQPAPSAGLRMRRLSSAKTYMTSSSFTERSVENTQETTSVSAHPDQPVHVPFSTEDTISYPFDDCHDSESATLSIHDQPADIAQELPEGDGDEEGFDGLWDIVETRSSSSKENPISPVGSHNNFCDREDSHSPASPPDNFVAQSSLNDFTHNLSDLVLPASETFKELPAEGVKEEALLDPDKSAALHMCSFIPEEIPTSCAVNDKELIITPDVETYPELLSEGVDETESATFHIPEESTTPFNSEEEHCGVNNIEHCSANPEFSVRGQETEKMEVADSVSFINVSPELSFLSSPKLILEGAEDAIEKESCELNTKEENAILINMEEEASRDPLIVSTSTSEQCLETSDASLCIQVAKAREVTTIVNFVTANPELMYTASPELLGEYDEDFKEDKISEHLLEQNTLPFNFEKEPILDSPVADTAEDVERTEVHDVAKEGLFESEGEETFSHRKLVVTSSNGDSNTQKSITDSIHVQFIPNSDINEALEGGREVFSELLHHGTHHSEGMFLSSAEINNDEVYSLTPVESPTSYAVNVKELPITPDVESDPEFFGKEVEEMVSSKFHMPEGSTAPFNSEGVLPSLLAVSNIEHCSGAPEFSLCGQETEKMEVAGSVSFINVSPELSLLSSPELVVEGSEDASEKELCELNTEEENAHIVSTSSDEQCLEASDVSLCIQDVKAREVSGIVNFVTANPEIIYPASPDLLAEGDDFKEHKTSDLHLPEQNGPPLNFEKEPILDSLVADAAENLLATPLYNEEVDITEVHDVVKEGLPEGEESFNQQKLIVSCSEDDSNTQSLTSDSMHEPLEGGEEALSEPLLQSTHHSEEMILSSAEINNDEFYSSNLNSYADVVEDPASFVGLSKFEGEMAITSPDTPIFLDEVKSAAIIDIDIASPKLGLQSELHDVGVEENEFSKFHVPEEIRTPFNLEEEVLLSPVAVNNTEYSVETPEFSLYNQESEEMEVVESVSFIKASPESSFLSSSEFVGEDGEDAREKETCELSTKVENETFINLEDQPLQAALVVSTTDQCLETSEFSLCSEDAKTTEVQEIISFGMLSPELNYTALPELLEEGEDLKDDETPDLHLHEQKGLHFDLGEPFLEPLVVDTAEDALAKSELLMHTEVVKMTEVRGVVEEVFSESENEAAFDHRNLVLASPDDDSTAQNLISGSTSAQFIPDTSVKETSQAGQQALPEPPHESNRHSEGTFLSSDEVNHDEVIVEAPFDGQEGLSKSEDKISLTSLETSILLDEIRTAENLTANSGPSQSIPDSNGFQSLHDQEQAPSETLHDVNFLIEGSHTSSDEGINSEIFSLYSRSSSCVSEINMLETLRSGASSSPENERGLSFDERSREIFQNMDSTENYTNSPVTAESILETNMIETLNVTDEATTGSLHESCSNFLDTFVAPDVINGMTQSDQHLDLSSSSFAPVVDAFETLQTGQGSSEPQLESYVTLQETQMSPKGVDDAENYFTNTIDDPQDSERTSTVALQDEDDLTLHKAYMSPEDISEVEKSLADDYASDLPHTSENHCFSEKVSPESQDPLSSDEILVHPDEVLKAENDLDSAKPSLYSTDVNLAEPCGIDHEGTQQQDETRLGSEDDYVVRQEANSENHYNNSGSIDIPDATVAESPQGVEKSSSEILYDGMFSFEGTLISLDGDSNAENFPSDSGSAMHTTQINTTSLLGLQEGSFKPEDENAINSISPYEIDTEETSSLNRGNSSSASSRHDISFMEAPQPQELPIDAGREKVYLEDEEPKDGESEDMKEIVEDLDDDHERKPVVTISHSTGSSTVSELAYVLYTKLATAE